MQMKATMGEEAFEDSVELAVRPAAALATVTGSGSVQAGGAETITLPAAWFAGTERYELVFMGTPSLAFVGGLRYVLQYPYGCLEQTVSRCLPLLYVRDLAEWVDPELAAPGQVEHLLASGLARVCSMQTADGGFAAWPGYREDNPWLSAYATQLLVETKKSGFPVQKAPYEAALSYLRRQLDRPVVSGRLTGGVSERRALELKAYCVYVLAAAGEPAFSWMTRLGELREELSVSARAHLGAALVASGQGEESRALFDAGLPSIAEGRETGGHLRSMSRDVALLLSALIDVSPESAQVAALASRLDGLRVDGRWGTTQENALALVAMGKYARLLGAHPNDYVATVQVAGREPMVFSHEERRRVSGDLGGKEVTVAVSGKGTLHCFWLAEGVPASGEVEEEDRGLEVRRRFLDRGGKALGDKALALGDTVVVEISVLAEREVENVVVLDLLPAGFEIENPRLATSDGRVKLRSTLSPDRVEMRDDRMLLFARGPREKGVYYYVIRAVSAGRFRVPAVQGSCMYDPGIVSTNGAGWIEVVHEAEGE